MPSQDILHHGALADYCEAFAQSYECNALLVKLFSKWIQFDLLVSLLTADAEFRLGKRTTQMTVGEIKEESGLSHRAIQIFLPTLAFYRLIEIHSLPNDRRARTVIPLPKLEKVLTDWLTQAFRFIDHCDLNNAIKLSPLLQDPEWFLQFKAQAGRACLSGEFAWQDYPLIAFFSERHAGFQLLAIVMCCHYRGQPCTNVSRYKSLFGVSRSHIFKLVQDAKAHGWIDQDAATAGYVPTEAMVVAFEAFVLDEAKFLLHHATTSRITSQEAREIIGTFRTTGL
ncbi:MAG: hypothetical protein LRY56_04865 [Burkholderiaceae bacterium]|nr:hypothetical protein [Burkholderiaceae bacterium]MCD8536855.1 hypothetical protein [Burkholderiaceae bacterium]